jgi:hypothetical protein
LKIRLRIELKTIYFSNYERELPAIWNKYYLKITERQLYNETDVLNDVLKSMATSPVSTCGKLYFLLLKHLVYFLLVIFFELN